VPEVEMRKKGEKNAIYRSFSKEDYPYKAIVPRAGSWGYGISKANRGKTELVDGRQKVFPV
jgi:hypothetical protein